ncbi:uncharacterized protein LOC114950684 [Acropora millepora]|uniref:uncharacterized protein LOC114950684 n=1 Tax=Acropora millepora TaxID=45264 RepID=UPI001CF3C299|nr:uncharacterized protein LOC114950684 [Acropora millepora]
MELPNSSFLPSPEEHAKLKKDFVLLVLRILAKNCKYFRQFGSMIPSHIPHQYSMNMSRQSQIVHLGLLEKNENNIPEMLEILQHCNEEYVPTNEDKSKILQTIQVGGDHLTIERAISAVNAVGDADNPYERLQGLVLKHEDFHCEMNFLQMLFDYLYKSESVGDLGTLYQLKARMNRKDVSEKVNKSYHGCEAFFSTVVDGYVVYAAMEFFGMDSPHSTPSLNTMGPSNIVSQKQKLYDAVEKLVEEYILLKVQPTATLFNDIEQSEIPQRYECR